MFRRSLFDVPIFIVPVGDWQNQKSAFLDRMDWSDTDCQLEHCWTDYHKFFRAGRMPDYFDHLVAILDLPMQIFQRENPGAYVNSAWCQRYSKNSQYHPAHTHGAIGWSSVFYAQLGYGHKPTAFISPITDPWSGHIDEAFPNVKEGDMIFFPSYLIHQSLPHNSNEDKIIFSMNFVKSPETIYV